VVGDHAERDAAVARDGIAGEPRRLDLDWSIAFFVVEAVWRG
jgi:hypothetical protein